VKMAKVRPLRARTSALISLCLSLFCSQSKVNELFENVGDLIECWNHLLFFVSHLSLSVHSLFLCIRWDKDSLRKGNYNQSIRFLLPSVLSVHVVQEQFISLKRLCASTLSSLEQRSTLRHDLLFDPPSSPFSLSLSVPWSLLCSDLSSLCKYRSCSS
jgi:hypothetical protein